MNNNIYNIFGSEFSYNKPEENKKLQEDLSKNNSLNIVVRVYEIIDKFNIYFYNIDPKKRDIFINLIQTCINDNYTLFQKDVVNYFISKIIIHYSKKNKIKHQEKIKHTLIDFKDDLIECINKNNIKISNYHNIYDDGYKLLLKKNIYLNSSLEIIVSKNNKNKTNYYDISNIKYK